MPVNARDFALVIGINDYPNYGSKGRPLRGAIGDAEDFAAWVRDPVNGGGVPEKQCVLIRSSVATVDPPQPQKNRIDKEMQKIWEMLPDDGGRRLYIYFSGHGQTQTRDDVALCMANWEIKRQAAAISYRKYLNLVIDCMQFEEVVMFMDCCRTRKVSAKGQESELSCPRPLPGERRVFIAHATEFQTAAHEAIVGDEGEDDDEPIVRGHFTRALLAALRGAAATETGGVTSSALSRYLDKVVPRIAKRSGHIQSPGFEFQNIVAGTASDLVFGSAPKISTIDATIRFSEGRVGTVRLEGPTMELIREGAVETAPWEETLEAAKHLLTHVETGEQLQLPLREVTGDYDVEF